MRLTILSLAEHKARTLSSQELMALLREHRQPGEYFPPGKNCCPTDSLDPAGSSKLLSPIWPLWPLWIDMTNASQEDWHHFLIQTGMPERDWRICSETRHVPQAEALSNMGFSLRLPCRNDWLDEEAQYLHIVLWQNMLITRHQDELGPLNTLRQRLRERDPDIADMPGLLLYLFQCLLEDGLNAMIQARTHIGRIEDTMETRPGIVRTRGIHHLKHIIGHLTGQAEEQLFGFGLLRGILPGIPPIQHVHEDIGELMDSLRHLERSLERLETRVDGFLAQLDSRLQKITDQRLQVLTLMSAIFMPLTFIAGVYGMNFEHIPFLHSEWGYFGLCLVMMGIAGAMLVFFWKKGWFE